MAETPALPVTLDRESATPLAVQLAEQLRAAAGDGRLRSGDRLPSTRALAGELGVSRTVTAAAYEQLHAEGWIAGRHGSGTYVTTAPPGSLPRRPGNGPPRHRAGRRRRPHPGLAVGGGHRAGGVAAGVAGGVARAADGAPAPCRPARVPGRRGRAPAATPRAAGRRQRGGAGHGRHQLGGRGAGPCGAAPRRRGGGGGTGLPARGRCAAGRGPAGRARDRRRRRPAGRRDPAVVRAVYCSPAHQYPLGGRMSAGRRVALVERAANRAGWWSRTTTTASCGTTWPRCRCWPRWPRTWSCTSAPPARSSPRRSASAGSSRRHRW